MEELNTIHWHDSILESVLEKTETDQLIFNIQYPVDWDNNIFEPRSIVFDELNGYSNHEIPFDGCPTILGVSVNAQKGEYTEIKIETNAGDRFVSAKNVRLVLNENVT